MLNPATGRLHAQYLVSGAKSGRWSARNPNIQQIPHDRDTRRIIIAAPGQVFVAGDFSSMELRAVAHISGETAMTEAFAASQDLHKLTAEAVLGVALDELGETEKERLRTLAKAINFGLIYGSGAKGLGRRQRGTTTASRCRWKRPRRIVPASSVGTRYLGSGCGRMRTGVNGKGEFPSAAAASSKRPGSVMRAAASTVSGIPSAATPPSKAPARMR